MSPTLTEIAPGAVHVSHWLSLEEQRHLVEECRTWSQGPVPMRSPKVRGSTMSVKTVCLGWHWQPYRYTRTASDVNGAPVLPVPDWLVELGQRAVQEAYETTLPELASTPYTPDAVLVNFYDPSAKMGMHQDKDEPSLAPVVSLSLGDTGIFRLGNTLTRTKPYVDVPLASGDLLVFGGPSRLAYHAVTKILPDTSPEIGMGPGRLNLTLRHTGLA